MARAALERRPPPAQLPPDFFSAEDHNLARLVRDIFADGAVAETMAVCTATG
jgi:hypothetical protein